MKKIFFLFFFIIIFFTACKENNMKIRIYYNSPGEWPALGRTVDFIKNGHFKYSKVYNLFIVLQDFYLGFIDKNLSSLV